MQTSVQVFLVIAPSQAPLFSSFFFFFFNLIRVYNSSTVRYLDCFHFYYYKSSVAKYSPFLLNVQKLKTVDFPLFFLDLCPFLSSVTLYTPAT